MSKKKEQKDYVVVNCDGDGFNYADGDGFNYAVVQAYDEKDAIQEYIHDNDPKSGEYNLYVVQMTDNDKYTLDVTSTHAVKKAAWID